MFSHPEFPQGSLYRVAVVWWLLDGRYFFLSRVPSGFTSSEFGGDDDCDILCLLILQEIVHFSSGFYTWCVLALLPSSCFILGKTLHIHLQPESYLGNENKLQQLKRCGLGKWRPKGLCRWWRWFFSILLFPPLTSFSFSPFSTTSFATSSTTLKLSAQNFVCMKPSSIIFCTGDCDRYSDVFLK